MTTFAQLRKTALSHAETAEQSRGTFTVAGRPFAVAAGDEVHLHLPPAEAATFVAAYPGARHLPGGAGVRLPDINGQHLNHWVRRAWLAQAPEHLAAPAAAAERAVAGAVGDLPRSIGRAATQALVNAGVTTLAQVARMTDAELNGLHGIGPRAVGLLREAVEGAAG